MRKEIIITTATETFAFGVTSDTYEQVYIPAGLQKMFDLQSDDIVMAVLRPNDSPKSDQVPYYAVYIIDESQQPDAEIEDIAPRPSSREMVTAALNEVTTPATTEQIVQRIADIFDEQTTTQSIGTELHNMHKRGDVARCCVKQIASQERASLVFWAKTVSAFQRGV